MQRVVLFIPANPAVILILTAVPRLPGVGLSTSRVSIRK